jgi:lipopolysaccharide/colanic/teichoic acid biosynthesis glycosyltransferase
MERSMYRLFGKALLDYVGAVTGLVIALVPMVLVATAIRTRMGRPVLHRARRPGFKGEMFVLYKFRTMIEAVDHRGLPLPDKERITPLGRFLRRTSLDELPQLFNVLKGEMSLVGPRPLNPSYLPLYTPKQARRHEVRPGITGLAQVKGRNQLSWDQRFAYDVEYVDNVSFLFDLRIVARTVLDVLYHRSVSPEGDLDVPLFTGDAVNDRTMPASGPSTLEAPMSSGPQPQTHASDRSSPAEDALSGAD